MRHTITAFSTYVEQQLNKCHSGTVHSVYKKTVNIQAGGRLLALQAASTPMSPISMITDMDVPSFEALSIQPGQTVTMTESRLELSSPGRLTVFLCQPKEVYCSLLVSPAAGFPCDELITRIRRAVSQSQAGIFRHLFCDSSRGQEEDANGNLSDSRILSAAQSHILRCSGCLEQNRWEAAAESLTKLIGLGIGLTPSGDDFLCGVLAGLILCGREDHPFAVSLCKEISARRFDTNDISRAFLDCSLQHHFSQAVISLSLVPSAETILNVFSTIGHSSGIDTLCGIAYGLWVLRPEIKTRGFCALT